MSVATFFLGLINSWKFKSRFEIDLKCHLRVEIFLKRRIKIESFFFVLEGNEIYSERKAQQLTMRHHSEAQFLLKYYMTGQGKAKQTAMMIYHEQGRVERKEPSIMEHN